MPEKLLWSTWSARAWPLSAAEEEQFREALGTPCTTFDRDDISLVVTALRCGAHVDVIRNVAPGLDFAKLAAAYDHIAALRRECAEDLEVLLDMASARDGVLTAHLAAARMMPVVVGRLVAAQGSGDLQRVREHTLRQLQLSRETALEIERYLDMTDSPEARRRLSVELHNPFGLGIWGHPYYLPRRVGDISPGRLRDLLGEA